MSYFTYHPLLLRLEQLSWRSGLLKCKKKQRGDLSIKETINHILKEQPEIYKTLDLPILMEEWQWMQQRQIIFPENELLIARLLKASAKIKHPENLFQKDQESFMLAIPKNFLINKQKSTGILVTLINWNERTQLINKFFNWLNLDSPLNESENKQLALCLIYQMPIGSKELYYRAIIPISSLNELINAKSAEKYSQILGYFNNITGAKNLNTDEANYQKIIVQLVLAILLYKKTHPEYLISGYPAKNRSDLNSVILKKVNSKILSIGKNLKESPTEHYRSWTFRQLFADRYYQNEYKDLPKGSRIIFVNDTWVNMKKIDPKTLIN